MYISEISLISNYRNLSGLSIKFNKSVNFIIGENNIGKTNILELSILSFVLEGSLNLTLKIYLIQLKLN